MWLPADNSLVTFYSLRDVIQAWVLAEHYNFPRRIYLFFILSVDIGDLAYKIYNGF